MTVLRRAPWPLGLLTGLLLALTAAAWAGSEMYFSPHGGIQARLLRAIQESQTRIDLAVFDLTSRPLATALLTAVQRGVRTRVVSDIHQASTPASLIPALSARGIPIRLVHGLVPPGRDHQHTKMHEKFALFDHAVLALGSYNWTQSAECCNWESLLVLTDSALLDRYQTRFDALWGSGSPPTASPSQK